MDIGEIIRAVQRELHVTADGAAGPQTWTAIYDAIVGKRRKPPAFNAVVDDRSERTIATLLPELVPYARALVHGADDLGISLRLISGTRTFAEQDALFAQGRTKPGRIVTNARGGFSNHNFGIAFDVGVFEGSRYLDE